MGDKLIMSAKERKRKVILEDVKRRYCTLQEGASRMAVSDRQAKRIWKRYREGGDEGLVHRRRGKRSNRAYPAALRERVLALYQRCYEDFGPTLACEC